MKRSGLRVEGEIEALPMHETSDPKNGTWTEQKRSGDEAGHVSSSAVVLPRAGE